MTLTTRTKEDILLIVSMGMIAYGLWDRERLILVFGGAFVFFLILWAGGEDEC